MKILKIIKKIPPLKHDKNNNQSKNGTNSLNKSNESGSYYSTVRPELVEFMINLGLIQQSMHCNNCLENMKWSPEKCIDLFHWKCPHCNEMSTLGMNLSFEGDNCSFKEALWILLAWLNNEDINDVSERLGIKRTTIDELYHRAGKTVERNIRSNILQWHLGGPGIIVLIDTFPDGLMNSTSSNKPILCVAELRGLPPTMWFEALETTDNREETNMMNRIKCLEVIKEIVQPGSIVVARRNSSYCSYDDLIEIKHKFKTLVSIEDLARHNSEEQNLFNNLNVIWTEASDVCTAAQHYHHSLVQSFLFCYMWRRRFKNESYQGLLNEISSFAD